MPPSYKISQCVSAIAKTARTMSPSIKRIVGVVIALFFFCPILVSGHRKTRLTWVNGIGYNIEHMKQGQKQISKLFGGKKVEFCHNPTSMSNEDDMVGYLGDLTQAGTQKLGRVTEEVNLLVA